MSDHKALLKHSRNYLLANLATKALAFISIPVYTRLLTVEEYGVIGVFMSIIGIAAVLFTLNSEVAISRYYYDAKSEEDFKRFVGSTIFLTMIILCFTTIIFILIFPILAKTLSFSKTLTLCILPVALYQVTNNLFVQIYNPLMQSKKVAIVSSIQAYLAFGLSALCMMSMTGEKYYGYVYGNILAMVILSVYIYKQIKPYYIFAHEKEHYKYILNYCLPYIPYTLSGVILLQFSRIFIGQNQGYTLAGSYTLTTNIAALMMVVISVTHSAWNPYYFRYMNAKDTRSLDSDYNLIWRATLLIAFVLSAFGKELALLLSKGGEYLTTIYVLPLLIIGYVFYQWAYVYLRNTGYAKRNIWNAYCVLLSGIANIVLNACFVPILSEVGAAIATCLSFLALLLLSWGVNRIVIKEYVPRIMVFIKPFICLVPFMFFLILNSLLIHSIGISILVKLTLCGLLGWLYWGMHYNNIMCLIKQRINWNEKIYTD